MVSSAELPVIKVLFIVLSIFLAVESIVEGLSSAGLTVEGLLMPEQLLLLTRALNFRWQIFNIWRLDLYLLVVQVQSELSN